MNLILVWLISSLSLLITSKVVKGFEVKNFGHAMMASLVVGLLNFILRPLLLILTLPINILTLGLFTFVVNAMVLKIAASVLKGFNVNSWWTAILGAIVLALVNMVLFWFMPGPSVGIEAGVNV